MSAPKYAQRKIKITSAGLFFNDHSVEKKESRLDGPHNFFKPFNSVFERELHNLRKQKRDFNKNAALNINSTRDAGQGNSSPYSGRTKIIRDISSASLPGKNNGKLLHSASQNQMQILESQQRDVISGARAMALTK